MVSPRAKDKKTLIRILMNGFQLEADEPLPLILSQKGILDIHDDVLNMSFDDIEDLKMYKDANGNDVKLPTPRRFPLLILNKHHSCRIDQGNPIEDTWSSITPEDIDDYRNSSLA
jgi:hypothetical protein